METSFRQTKTIQRQNMGASCKDTCCVFIVNIIDWHDRFCHRRGGCCNDHQEYCCNDGECNKELKQTNASTFIFIQTAHEMSSSVRDLMKQAKIQRSLSSKKIEHPLVTYNAADQPQCKLCHVNVETSDGWMAHQSTKTHLQKLQQQASEEKERRQQAKQQQQHDEATTTTNRLPAGFFDGDSSTTTADATANSATTTSLPAAFTTKKQTEPTTVTTVDGVSLPKGFFDDEKKEASVTGTKTKKELKSIEIEKEFEIFKEAIRPDLELETVDEADAAAAAAEAALAATSEQLNRLQEIRSQVKKRPREEEKATTNGSATTASITTTKIAKSTTTMVSNSKQATKDDNDDDDDEDLDSLLDWRSKRI